jgi:hypothetical protein
VGGVGARGIGLGGEIESEDLHLSQSVLRQEASQAGTDSVSSVTDDHDGGQGRG